MADISRCVKRLAAAEEQVALAEQTRDQAHHELEAALAEVGWRRISGAFSPNAGPFFGNALFPSATLTLDGVLRVLEQQRKAMAA